MYRSSYIHLGLQNGFRRSEECTIEDSTFVAREVELGTSTIVDIFMWEGEEATNRTQNCNRDEAVGTSPVITPGSRTLINAQLANHAYLRNP